MKSLVLGTEGSALEFVTPACRRRISWVMPDHLGDAEMLAEERITYRPASPITDLVLALAATAPPLEPDGEVIIAVDRNERGQARCATVPSDDLLTTLATRSAAALTGDEATQRYLREQGVTDPAVWAQFRLGAGGEEVATGWDAAELAEFRRIGLARSAHPFSFGGRASVNIPSYDPRNPDVVVGFVRLTPAQNKHHFITPAEGIGCTVELARSERVVLVDGPLIGLRLAQAGVRDVALIEDPQTLAPLADWLASREVIIAGYRKDRIEAMRRAAGLAGRRATVAVVTPDIRSSPPATFKLLRLVREQVRPPEPTVELTPLLIRDLHRYGRERVRSGEATEALRELEGDIADLVNVYDIGFLPNAFRDDMPTEMQRALRGHRLGGFIIVPARDEGGTIVDLLALRAEERGNATRLFPEPRGMLGGNIGTAYADLIVADYFRGLSRLFAAGHRNVLLLRGATDARMNAERLRAAGVTSVELRVRRESTEMAQALQVAGIQVRNAGYGNGAIAVPRLARTVLPTTEVRPVGPVLASESAPASPTGLPASAPIPTAVTIPVEPLELVEHDRQQELATFKAGLSVYVVEVPWDREAKLEVTLRHGVSPILRDRIDLAAAAARQRYASAAPMRCGIPAQVVEAHLLALLDRVRALQRAADPLAQPNRVDVVGVERDEAMALLTAPNLLDRLMVDLDLLGWAGESEAKLALYLATVSRLLPEPLWASLMATQGAGKSFGIQVIADLTPPEDLIQVTVLTDRALFHQDEHALRHKLLVVDEAEALSHEVVTALRTLKTRGGLSMRQALPAGSSQRARQVDARGPVAFITSTAGRLDEQLQSRCLVVPVDESRDQTGRIVAMQGRLAANPRAGDAAGGRDTIIRRHHGLQRLLAHREVSVPFAERIEFPTSSVRHRRAYPQLLSLIRASALLHQHQRLSDQGQLAADERDFAVAARLAESMGIVDEIEMGRGARQLLAALRAVRPAQVTLAKARDLLPTGTAYSVRKAIADLEQLGFLDGPPGGRGVTGTYHLTPLATSERSRIRLMSVDEHRERAHEATTPRNAAG